MIIGWQERQSPLVTLIVAGDKLAGHFRTTSYGASATELRCSSSKQVHALTRFSE